MINRKGYGVNNTSGGLNIVGQMVLRNEADVVAEAVHEAFRWVNDLVVLDGKSDDGTTGILKELARLYDGGSESKGKRLHLIVEQDPMDGKRAPVNINVLRSRLQELTAVLHPDWVLSIDADEIYHCDENSIDPVTAVAEADTFGANVVRCWVPQFWLTFADLRAGCLNEDETISVQERRRWYSWGHMGTFIWKWDDALYYPDYPSKRTPEMPNVNWRQWQKAGPFMPVCKHYTIRSVSQGLVRAGERLKRGGCWQFGKYAQNWIIDEELAQLHYFEREWNSMPNHDEVKAYLAGKLTRRGKGEEASDYCYCL